MKSTLEALQASSRRETDEYRFLLLLFILWAPPAVLQGGIAPAVCAQLAEQVLDEDTTRNQVVGSDRSCQHVALWLKPLQKLLLTACAGFDCGGTRNGPAAVGGPGGPRDRRRKTL